VIYTTQHRRFVYDTWDIGSRLARVMVECTLSITHYLRLKLQHHTIDLVRTCRISSFCTVAWQLARFQLTRRIALSLGDSWASYLFCLCIGLFVCYICCVFRSDVDSLLTALEYCVKQHGVAPNYSNVLKMLIALEDADRLQKGMHAFCPLKSCLTFCPCDAMLAWY